ncbi:phosphoribosyl-dephospho-CoA transferase (holo-ACP synthetase) [Thermanaerovibrio velox DSM 12556]|uniref:citrate lyase holo-[acyl-carrier protein] synthase n=1 Tax=Thermanaerovibrio velox DSM 12556 TaxID=926567 RepID=H0UND2_9BACT|nr:citrate lyase holo-[acyl-carrier protein] synthase [Thermanaerovibrio velox]EHM09339.1 phosphoribosyl-dephospho-CoA transferase (holo-ACP synthetase) [Thermanaerovibrio velox DSM 12556]
MSCLRGRNGKGPSPLEEVLRAREERTDLRRALGLELLDPRRYLAGPLALVQGGLNVPGWPKGLKGGMERLEEALSLALEGLRWQRLAIRQDPLGPFLLAAVERDPMEVKGRCVAAEEGLPWGRLVDLDVFFPLDLSRPIKRHALGSPERRCLMCRRPAKECAQAARHHPEALRRRALLLWGFPEHFLQVFPPELEGQKGTPGAPREA